MKIEITQFGTKFNMHCPRCGNAEWSEKEYYSGKNDYHKCMHCGADVCTDFRTKFGVVIEQAFYEFTPMTKDVIEGPDGLADYHWRLPEKKPTEEDENFAEYD